MIIMSLHDLNQLIGKNIQVNRKGPHSFKGELLDIQSDYIVLESDQGRAYIPIYHIKNISFLSDQQSINNIGKEAEEYDHPSTFTDLVMKYKYHWVQIDGGPNKVEGIPIEISGDNLIVSSKKEVINVVLSHVKSLVYKPQHKKDNENQKEQNQETNYRYNEEEREDRSEEAFEKYIQSRISDEQVINRISDNDYRLKIFYSDRYNTPANTKQTNSKKSAKARRR